jgi:tRNA (cmo5U34)-methyltransferase
MAEFEKSEWIESQHVKDFVENADIYILERKRLFNIMKSFYNYFLKNKIKNGQIKVLDLGCGDGALTNELLKVDNRIEATLVDGSSDMIKTAQQRLKSYDGLNYINKTFQELIENDVLDSDFNFIVSSLAIHHLSAEDKESLFQYILHHLKEGGFFLNVDVVRAPNEALENWYRQLWVEWIAKNEIKMGSKESFQHIPQQYKNNPDNYPEMLENQLNALKSVGFSQVDCYYKYGIFSIFGGKK